MTDRILVDVWSDVACPWCYIGKRRLEAGIAAFASESGTPAVDVVFRSFQLDPDAPRDFAGGAAEYLAEHKGIPREAARAMQAQVTLIAADVGLAYDFDALRPANTLDAHRLLHLAKDEGNQVDVKERLFRAHFEEGRNIGDDEELADIADEAGMDRDRVLSVLHSDALLEAVGDDTSLAARLGIHGVPFFVIAGRYGISGAQPPETFVRAFRQAAT
ncbi:MAG TPA: DsbA family oxidoreductase [Acidimicrobiia bacterium]|nr:DsbA family oxidoreductase [Acidimicrobiia bacterium]